MDQGRYILLVSRRKFCFAAPDSSPKSSPLFKNGDTPFEQFKYSSGVDSDWSTLRSSKETLLGGGTPGGPVSFTKA